MVQYLHFRILKFPLMIASMVFDEKPFRWFLDGSIHPLIVDVPIKTSIFLGLSQLSMLGFRWLEDDCLKHSWMVME